MKIIAFDLDDTLFPEREYVVSGFRAVDRWLSSKHAVRGFFETAYGLYLAGRRGRIFNEALEALEFSNDNFIVRTLVNIYREHVPEIHLHTDARWAIDYHRSLFPLAIITDGYLEVQKKKVSALGIGSLISTIIYSDEFGRSCWKPSTEPYLRVMRKFGCEGPGVIYVGDNPVKDFVGAKALGWTTVQIIREDGEYSGFAVGPTHEAHRKISSLYELAL